ncbi:hypothetical protein NEOLEDRAFT_792026 [Neolentinus lepideus HHB14362 ss-1]|uniref:Uncharacterized protein n=1 Tax=Neolentinus lepideus HHB14362 ss-1 TaxID=1314782 RepID=A0A165PKJ3_9AGAM|nr:hypothetical protein NEOLEDRAFT_792026 [Neolentinus lepideus HHB14362 ss-1]
MPAPEQHNSRVVIQLNIPSLEDALNRLKCPGAYFAFYLALWASAIPLVVTALLDSYSWRGLPFMFYFVQAIVNSSTLAEVYLRTSYKGQRFLLSGATLLEVLFCITTVITWTLSIVPQHANLANTAAAIGAIATILRGVFQFLRLALIALKLTVQHPQDNPGGVFNFSEADVDSFDIRNLFADATDRSVRGLEEVLITSFKNAVLGTVRIAQLVLAIVAVITAFHDGFLLLILLNSSIVFEIIMVVYFRNYLSIPFAITIMDGLVCLLGSAAVVLIAKDPRDWRGPEKLTRVFTIIAGFVILARSVIQLLYYLYTIFLSCKIVFESSSETIRLVDDDENLKNAEDGSAVAEAHAAV